jgi:hypothetical protein
LRDHLFQLLDPICLRLLLLLRSLQVGLNLQVLELEIQLVEHER